MDIHHNCIPLTRPQYQIWLASESCPDKALYTESVLLTFDNAPDPGLLNRALNRLVETTETLRIRVTRAKDGPLQYDAGYTPFACRVVPLSGEDELAAVFDEQARFCFDLYDSPLFNAVIYTLPGKTALLLRVHHLVADGYGFTSVYDRLLALCAGEEPAAFDSFLSRAAAESSNEEERSTDRLFWQDYLGGAEPGRLPHPMPDQPGHRIAWSSHSVGSARSSQLRAFAAQQNVTPYCVFFAAYAVYLSRMLGTEDVIIITPRLNRDTAMDRNAAGMYTLAVPVRLHITPETSFAALCQEVQVQNRLAAAHKRYGLSEIMGDLSRKGAAGTLSHFTLSYQNFALPLHGLPVRYAMHFGGAMTNLLTLHILDWGGNGDYRFQLDYRAAYYTPHEIAQTAQMLCTILDQGIAGCTQPCRMIELLSDGDKLCQRALLSGPVLPVDPEATIISRFRAQAAKHPDRRALSGKGASYTFQELDEVSDRVARNLIAAGVKPQSYVAFLMPRTTALPVMLLGILKAGAAYVPIDGSYPEERIRFILTDSKAGLLITDADIPDAGCPVIAPGPLFDPPQTPDSPLPAVGQDWLCYVIYTSGTTGKPKGVMIEHRGIVNFMQPDNNEFNRDICANGRGIVAVGSICFDISMFELFSTLLNGVPVVFADEDGMNNPDALARYITENDANILHCTPSRLLAYLEEPSFREAMRGVDVVLAAGEAFTQPLLEALHKATSARLYNGYGPTEITIGATVGRIREHITIGSTIAGARIYLLDKNHRIVPPGATGEIAVAGYGVARGYLGRPDLTAERFIDLRDGPVSDRVYLTGDYGYALPDGNLAYCGRNDEQVKLRGLRIELKEIERCIESFPGIRQCAVLVRLIDGREHLCCFYSAAEPREADELKQYAGGFLTRYMVPDLFVYMTDLPHTSNGKIDKRALANQAIQVERTYIPPRNARERAMCRIFSQVLKIPEDEIGATDSFFDLGGTSLQAAQIVLLAKHEEFDLEYGQVFDHPTVRDLVQCVDQDAAPHGGPSLPAGSGQLCTPKEAAILRDTLCHNRNYRKGLQPLGTVLLTGATGFLGIHVLYELLTTGYNKIYCMVRPKNNLTPEKRLKGSLFYYFENNFAEAFGQRLFAVDGDLIRDEIVSLPDGVKIDTVIHCAADVSHFGVGNRIRQTNVDGVRNVIAFCKKHDAALVHISTLSVGGFIEREMAEIGVSLSEQRLWVRQDLSNDYLESKFTAEKLILLEIARGLRAKIMRVGNLQGRITDGEFQMNQATNGFTKLLQSIVRTGRCPQSLARSWINFSPVDAVARAICRLAGSAEEYTVFHIFDSNDLPVSKLLTHISALGYPVRTMEDEDFDKFMLHAAEDPSFSGALDGFLTRVTGGRHLIETPCESGFSIRALEQEGFLWPEISDEYLSTYLTGLDTLGAFQ